MKKLFFVAALGVASVMSASSPSPKIIDDGRYSIDDYINDSNFNRQICVVFHATCTSAYTCFQGESIEDVQDEAVVWAGNIQQNYCMYNSPFTP